MMMTLNYYRTLYHYWTLNNHSCVVVVMMVWRQRCYVMVMTWRYWCVMMMMWCIEVTVVMTNLNSVVMTIMMTLC